MKEMYRPRGGRGSGSGPVRDSSGLRGQGKARGGGGSYALCVTHMGKSVWDLPRTEKSSRNDAEKLKSGRKDVSEERKLS